MKPRLVLTSSALVVLVSLSGCSGGSSSTASSGSADAAAAPGVAPAGPVGAAAPNAKAIPARLVSPTTVVRTGELDVQVDDLVAAAEQAGRLARATGGRVDSDERSTAQQDGSAVLVLRLPPKSYDATLEQLAALGTERSRNLGLQDVSESLVDLDARLATQRASVTRVRTLLDRAASVGEVVQVEGELTKRTAELESFEARVQELRSQVALASLTLRLSGRATAPPQAGAALGFGDGLAAAGAPCAGSDGRQR